jgi:predicted transcriptional regulator
MLVRIKRCTYLKVIEHLSQSPQKKIAAIKAVRTDASVGLREAKEAVELLAYERGLRSSPVITDHRLVVGPIIKKIIVDYGSGDIEVDIESMELKALMEMQAIGLNECADILDLVAALTAYQDGKKIGVIREPDESR